ncbi:hypothetical protein IPC1343_32810 [Pseudomonas aeruginosa]|nr:hypothetical protein AO985_31685 [Pseudomonas aeruginosa]TEG04102.1 hypothetical protein IPC1343_32810 [Pseudomonas aeruginosa]
MLFAPTLADRAILPTAWRGRYFFNRIGQKQTWSVPAWLDAVGPRFGPLRSHPDVIALTAFRSP